MKVLKVIELIENCKVNTAKKGLQIKTNNGEILQVVNPTEKCFKTYILHQRPNHKYKDKFLQHFLC